MSRYTPTDPTVMTPVESDFDADRFEGFLRSHPLRQHVRWWKAYLDPNFSTQGVGKEQYIREEQVVDASVYALVRGLEPARKLFPDGELREGDIAFTFIPDELPLTNADWVMPIGGDYDAISSTTPLTRESYHREFITKGDSVKRLQGTVVSVGTQLTFTVPQLLRVGDVIKSVGQSRKIVTVVSSNVYTVNTAPSPAWNGTLSDKCYEELTIPNASYLDYIRTSSKTYIPNVDFEVSLDGSSQIRWLVAGTSPVEGERMSVAYYYTPIFMAQDSLGVRRHTHNGRGFLCTMMLRLVSHNDWKKSNLAI